MANDKLGALLKGALIVATFLLPTGPVFAYEDYTDYSVTQWVEAALDHDPRVEASNVTVGSTDGIVTLEGTVGTIAGKKFADLEVKKIAGVRGVINKLEVNAAERPDADIVYSVRRRILSSSEGLSQDIQVMAEKGKVILSGTVHSSIESREAQLLAEEVNGVEKVENKLTIDWQRMRPDDEIEGDVIASLENDVYLEDFLIAVSVKKGVVTVTGDVGSGYEKYRAGQDVKWIPNVLKVNNNLLVRSRKREGSRKSVPGLPDSEIKKAVEDELGQDERVDAKAIVVEVAYGGVTLSGRVNTREEKMIAGTDAWNIVGVHWVTNQLFANEDRRADDTVRDDILFNLNSNAVTEGFDYEVKIEDAVVTLKGKVPSWNESWKAANIATRIKGVYKVINNIQWDVAKGQHTFRKAQIEKDVRSHLLRNWSTHTIQKQIKVQAEKGAVTLTGDVNTKAQRHEAGQVAYKTRGVWSVKNHLTVEGKSDILKSQREEQPYSYPYYYEKYHIPMDVSERSLLK